MRRAGLIIAMALLAGCETMQAGGGVSNAHSAAPIDLGDWRHATAAATMTTFEGIVHSRYPAGSSIAAAASDLQHNEFNCAVNHDASTRGEPPAQICRRTVAAENCTNTWQVHLFGAGDALTRARPLYDRRCGGDGLLGGPG